MNVPRTSATFKPPLKKGKCLKGPGYYCITRCILVTFCSCGFLSDFFRLCLWMRQLASEGKEIHPPVVGRAPGRARHVHHRCSHCVSPTVVPRKWKNDSPSKSRGMAWQGTASQGTWMVRRYRSPVSCFLDTKECAE